MIYVALAIRVSGDEGQILWGYDHSEPVLVSHPDKEKAPDVESALIKAAELVTAELERAEASIRAQIAIDLPTMAAAQREWERTGEPPAD